MGRTPFELARSITAEEFSWLRAYASVEPVGFEMENWRAGIVAATVANTTARKGRAYKPADFYPKIAEPVELDRQSRDEQVEVLKRAFGGNVIVRKKES